jgi:3-methylcrotonyl-CoA carboxylase alpha subunit
MLEVYKSEDFAGVLASAKREAAGAFGNDAMLIERLVQQPRHIEIQIFGDTRGNYVHLFERDCSTQRRHQKVLEEAPAPGMTPALRKQMGEAAVAAARAVNYVGAGTVEFIVEQLGGYDHPEQMKFYFMEMNTRLQVEHGVTEAVTGLDLVEWQLRVAAGETLPLKQEQLRIHGHAIEARICAENPDKDFLPATGTLHVYRTPPHSHFAVSATRMDDGVREGDAISPFYDSLIAKLVTYGETRDQALGLLDEALAETHIVGLNTNVQFLRHAIATPSFSQAKLDTALILREKERLFNQDPLGAAMVAASAIACSVLRERAAETDDPFSRRDGFRSHGIATRRVDYEYRGAPVTVKLRYLHDGFQLRVGDAVGQPLDFTLLRNSGGATGDRIDVRYGGRRQVVRVYRVGPVLHVFGTDGAAQITEIDPLARAGEGAGEGGRLTAPMPGKVVSFAVRTGDKVSKGQPLAVMEAMKMEHTISAPEDGVVGELLFAPGDQVPEGAELLHLTTAK